MFRRRRNADIDATDDRDVGRPDAGAPDAIADDVLTNPDSADVPPREPATSGPWDDDDAPDDGVERVDLGGLRLPVPDGGELRVELDEATQVVQAVLIVRGPSVLQIGAFAAPKTEGIWADVADEIVVGIRQAGGSADPADGPFGREIRAQVPGEDEHGNRVVAPTRFIGVDGPRWFLRGLLQGPAALDTTAAAEFERVFRGTIVVRGGEAMAPRDPLPLRIPREAGAAGADSAPDETPGHHHGNLDPFERGPEITEVR